MMISRRDSAFTLLELLIVIGVVATLAAMLLGVNNKVKNKADQVKCLNNMRQVGNAISLYVNDHDGTMPGPLDSGQKIFYDAKMLSGFLYTYLGAGNTLPPKGTIAPAFVCPAWSRVVPKPGPNDNVICYVLNRSINNVNVFGYPGQSSPMKAALIASLSNSVLAANSSGGATTSFSNSATMLMTDVDQINWAYDKSAGWYGALPKTPVHGGGRNSLFYDYHAEVRPLSAIP